MSDEQEIPTEKEHFQDAHSGGGHGGTEMGWLVSYADMMTLLFGLFVILFSLTTKYPGQADEMMKTISKKYFSAVGTSEIPSEAPPQPIESRSPSSAPVIPTLTPTPTVIPTTTPTPVPIEAPTPQKKEAEKIEKPKGDSEKKTLEKKVTALESELKESKRYLKEEREQAKRALDDARAENEKLQEELKGIKNQSFQRYMVVTAAWSTEKHDIDLEVKTPQGQVFNFKKRAFQNEPGRFEIDSRYGPGIEMWRAENFVPGVYKVKVKLYGVNGNTEPAKLKLSLFTQRSSFRTQEFTLDAKSSESVFELKVDEQGNIEKKP